MLTSLLQPSLLQLPFVSTEVSFVRKITPAEARMLRDRYPFSRQRFLRVRNIERLASEMVRGEFIPALQIYIAQFPDGTYAILNGNHTLEAAAKAGVTLNFTITIAPVRDENHAGRIYAVFDSQKVRTWRDALRSIRVSDDIRKPEHAMAALTIIHNRFRSSSSGDVPKTDVIGLLDHYGRAVNMFWDAISGGPSAVHDMLRRAGIMAVALAALDEQPSLAHEFFSAIAKDDGLRNGTPEKALLNWLRGTENTAGHIARHEHIVAAALAWNAKFHGEERDKVQPNALKHARPLAGTSHQIQPVRTQAK